MIIYDWKINTNKKTDFKATNLFIEELGQWSLQSVISETAEKANS